MLFFVGFLASIAGLYQDAIKPVLFEEEQQALEFGQIPEIEDFTQLVSVQDGEYEVVDAMGFDEPVKRSQVEIRRSHSGVYILLEIFADSGYYKYELEGEDRGNVIVADLVSTNDQTIPASGVVVTVTTKTNGKLFLAEVDAEALEVKLLLIMRPKSD